VIPAEKLDLLVKITAFPGARQGRIHEPVGRYGMIELTKSLALGA
jgi:hypothetical protein